MGSLTDGNVTVSGGYEVNYSSMWEGGACSSLKPMWQFAWEEKECACHNSICLYLRKYWGFIA